MMTMASWGMMGMLFCVLLIGIVVYLVLSLFFKNDNQRDAPLNLLKERYARGEISSQEYEERKQVIDKK